LVFSGRKSDQFGGQTDRQTESGSEPGEATTVFHWSMYCTGDSTTQQDTISDIGVMTDRVLPPKTPSLQINNCLIRQLYKDSH